MNSVILNLFFFFNFLSIDIFFSFKWGTLKVYLVHMWLSGLPFRKTGKFLLLSVTGRHDLRKCVLTWRSPSLESLESAGWHIRSKTCTDGPWQWGQPTAITGGKAIFARGAENDCPERKHKLTTCHESLPTQRLRNPSFHQQSYHLCWYQTVQHTEKVWG